MHSHKEFFTMWKKKYTQWAVYLIFFLILPIGIRAQRPAQYMRLGEAAEAEGKMDEAFSFYQQAYLLDSANFDVTQHYAHAARWAKNDVLAEKLYQKMYAKDSGKLFPEGLFWLAMMQKSNGKYGDALRNFKKYAKKQKKKGGYTYQKSVREIESCQWAINYRLIYDSLSIVPMSDAINSPESENAPLLKKETFYYSAFRIKNGSDAWQLMCADWLDSTAANPRTIQIKKTQGDIANLTLGTDDQVFFTSCQENKKCGLWQAKLKDETLYDVEELTVLNDAHSFSTMPAYTVIQGFPYLFFVSDREGGSGKADIWMSRQQNGTWSEPINAGDAINSPEDELSPFYSDGKLYFSSSWHNGFGNQDIFQISGIPGHWDTPANMGKPLNSSKNDFFFSWFPDQRLAFFSSNREGGKMSDEYNTCCNDIYQVTLPSPKKTATEKINPYKDLAELNRILPVRLYFHNDEPNPRSLDTTTSLRYSDAYRSYKNLFDVYLRENAKGLSGEEKEEAEYDVEDFFLLNVDKGMYDLDLFFDLLLKELENGQHLRISIRGFASPRAKSDYNEKLTRRRIASLINEMKVVKNGVFLPYIHHTSPGGGKLDFETFPFGEYKADQSVSDDLFDERQSIYNRGARLERKIEIESVAIDTSDTVLSIRETTHDFGVIADKEPVYWIFPLINQGQKPLAIDSVVADCGCTLATLEKNNLLPGEKINLEVVFDPTGKEGKVIREVIIYSAGEAPKVITLFANIKKE